MHHFAVELGAAQELEQQQAAQTGHQTEEAQSVGQEPRDQQQQAAQQQDRPFEHLQCRHLAPIHGVAHPHQGADPLPPH